MNKKMIEIESIVLRFHRMMAHVFSRSLTVREMDVFKRIQSKYDEVMKPLAPEIIRTFMDKGRAAFYAEEKRLEEQQKKAA